jgi:hypothetical protein
MVNASKQPTANGDWKMFTTKSLHFEVTAPVNHDGDFEPRVHVQFYSITNDVKKLGTVQHVLQSEWQLYRSHLEQGGWTERKQGKLWFEH